MEDFAIKTALIGALLSLFLSSFAYLVSEAIVKRYKIKKHYIIRLTTFFTATVDTEFEVFPGDDLEEIRWFNYEYLKKNYKKLMVYNHWYLFEILMNVI